MQSVVFKEWAPDQPDLGGESLITARNVLPATDGYEPFATFTANGESLGGAGLVNAGIATVDSSGNQYLYAFVSSALYKGVNNGQNWTANGSISAGSIGCFAQYGDLVIHAGPSHRPLAHTVGAASSFTLLATSGTVRPANAVGVVGQFVVMGGLSGNTAGGSGTALLSAVQWSSIDQPRNWPTPGSSTAIASQSGLQELGQQYGLVQAIHGGDQFAVILQEGAVSRMTYVGPPAVFQFDTIDNTQGSTYRQGSIKVGNLTYFLSQKGFCVTDGVTVKQIGDGKVDEYFRSSYSGNTFFTNCWAYDPEKNLLYFGFGSLGSSNLDQLLIYNPTTNTWSSAEETGAFRQLVTPAPGTEYSDRVYAFSTNNPATAGSFTGTPGTAVLETSDVEYNPGGRSYIDGVKPHVEYAATAPAMTVRVGYRNDFGSVASYTSATTANSATGFANFRVDAKYIRAEVSITGPFTKAVGFVASIEPSSER